MSQISLLYGVTATNAADFSLEYPVNLEAIPIDSGISKANLRSASGASAFGTGPGTDRGGIVWNDTHYRVMGTKLVSVSASGTVTTLGDVGGSGPVSLDFGPDRLQIRSGINLYYWSGTTLTQVTDTDLGPCLDQCHMEGYTVSTDGTYIVVTDLAAPTSVNPLKYGSAEESPDPIVGILHDTRGELIVFGTETIQPFNNVGGSLFPFAPILSATVPIGCVGPQAKCHYLTNYAFVGAARNEATGVWIGLTGTPKKISTRAVEDELAAVADQSVIQIEQRTSRNESRLLVHLPDKTLIYLANATLHNNDEPVWYVARSGRGMDKAYRLRNAVLAHGKWIVGDTESSALGQLEDDLATHFGEAVGWQFDTLMAYNDGKGYIIHELELVGLPGRGVVDNGASVFLSFTMDGQTWSIPRACLLPANGARSKRTVFRPNKLCRNYVGMRFRGDSNSLQGIASLRFEAEALAA